MLFNNNSEDRALSPVIGVVLLVGLTVILVAVVGGFVTDFGSDVEAAPNAQIGVDFDTDNNNITVSHDGGNDLNPETLEYEYEPQGGTTETQSFNETYNQAGLMQAGEEDEIDVDGNGTSIQDNISSVDSGDTFRIIWTGESGNNREVLLEEIVP